MLPSSICIVIFCLSIGYGQISERSTLFWTMYNVTDNESYILRDNDTLLNHLEHQTDGKVRKRFFDSSTFIFGAIAADNRAMSVFTHDRISGYLYRLDDDLLRTDVVFKGSSLQLNDIAVDWLSRNIYYTDPLIGVGLVSYKGRFTILIHKVSSLQGIDVDPTSGLLFYADADQGHVFKATLTGENIQILSGFEQGTPTALVVDSVMKTVYWLDVDNSCIQSWNYATSSFQSRPSRVFQSSPLTDIEVYQRTIFITDSQNEMFFRSINSTQLVHISVDLATNVHSYGVAISSPDRQPDMISPCDNDNACSHICIHDSTNRPKCICQFGYHSLGTLCQSEALQDDFVIFIDASTKVIYQVDLSTEAFHAISMPSSVFARLRRVTFDPLHNYIYWTDLNGQSIWRMNVRNRTSESFISVETSSVIRSMKIAGKSDYLYYLDSGLNQIRRLHLNDREDQFLLQMSDQDNVLEMQLDEDRRHLYWTNCGGRPQIERASIDDSLKRQTLIADDLRCPSVLALDLSENRMYWWDERSNRLERASLDGNSRELFSLVPSTIVGLAVDKEFVYLAEKRKLERINKKDRIRRNLGPEYFDIAEGISVHILGDGISTTTITVTETEATSSEPRSLILYVSVAVGLLVLTAIIVMSVIITIKCGRQRRSRQTPNQQNQILTEDVQPGPSPSADPWYEPLRLASPVPPETKTPTEPNTGFRNPTYQT